MKKLEERLKSFFNNLEIQEKFFLSTTQNPEAKKQKSDTDDYIKIKIKIPLWQKIPWGKKKKWQTEKIFAIYITEWGHS